MSMHIVGPALTTTSYKKREQKRTRAQQEELERGWRGRNQRLKQMGLPKETFDQYVEWVYGKGKKEKVLQNSKAKTSTTLANRHTSDVKDNRACDSTQEAYKNPPPSFVQGGGCTKKPSPVYTGTKIIGVAVMHKSNMVPVFSDEQAVDISKMRR